MKPRAVVDACGLEEKSVGRVEQSRQDLHRRQVAGDVGVGEGAQQNQRGENERKDHPKAKQCAARTTRRFPLFVKSPLSAGAEDWEVFLHVPILLWGGDGGRWVWFEGIWSSAFDQIFFSYCSSIRFKVRAVV